MIDRRQTRIVEHTKIQLPFRDDMALVTLEGRKHCTTRGSKKGSIGDQFDVALDHVCYSPLVEQDVVHMKGTFEIFAVRALPIWFVAKNLHYLEGFLRERDFITVWDQLHEERPFGSDLERMVWSHFYFRAGTYDYAPEEMVKAYGRKIA